MSVHELLPWYANDTLGPEERAAFEEHLTACPSCRAELELIENMRSQLREAGPAALSDHPSPEALLAAVRPEQADVELDPDAARDVRQHVALCLTCADEAEWLTGEAAATAAAKSRDESARPPDVAPRRRGLVLPWLGLVAALAVIAVLAPLAWRDSIPTPDVATTAIVPPTQREDSPRAIEVLPDSIQVVLMFEVDLGPEDYPARLRVESGGHEIGTVVVKDGAALFRELYVVVPCHRSVCRDGDYFARLIKASGLPAAEYPFRLETAPRAP